MEAEANETVSEEERNQEHQEPRPKQVPDPIDPTPGFPADPELPKTGRDRDARKKLEE